MGSQGQLHPEVGLRASSWLGPHTFPLCIQGSGLWRAGCRGPKRTTLLGVGGKGKPERQGGSPSMSKLSDGDRGYQQKAVFVKGSMKPCLQNKGENC